MIKHLFKQNSVYSGVITDFHYQTDIADMGIHFVTLKLDDGREVEAALNINSYKPFDIGQRICGAPFPAPIGKTDRSVDLSLTEISKIEAGQNPLITQWIMRPLRGAFEELAMVERWRINEAVAMGKEAGNPLFGKWAHMAGSQRYDETGKDLPRPDPAAMKTQYMDTWQP